jgi:hypothetical protein
MTKTLSPKSLKIVQRVVLELARRPVTRTRHSLPIKLGSKSQVLINPSMKDTQNNVNLDDDPETLIQRNRVREAYALYNKLVIANDEEAKRQGRLS